MFPAEESSGPPHKPKMKKHVAFANCAMTDNTAMVPFGNGLPMKAASIDNKDSYHSKCQSLGPRSAYAATA